MSQGDTDRPRGMPMSDEMLRRLAGDSSEQRDAAHLTKYAEGIVHRAIYGPEMGWTHPEEATQDKLEAVATVRVLVAEVVALREQLDEWKEKHGYQAGRADAFEHRAEVAEEQLAAAKESNEALLKHRATIQGVVRRAEVTEERLEKAQAELREYEEREENRRQDALEERWRAP